MGTDTPIEFIHDVGAGGLSNALPELVHDGGKGGVFDLRKVPSADSGVCSSSGVALCACVHMCGCVGAVVNQRVCTWRGSFGCCDSAPDRCSRVSSSRRLALQPSPEHLKPSKP